MGVCVVLAGRSFDALFAPDVEQPCYMTESALPHGRLMSLIRLARADTHIPKVNLCAKRGTCRGVRKNPDLSVLNSHTVE